MSASASLASPDTVSATSATGKVASSAAKALKTAVESVSSSVYASWDETDADDEGIEYYDEVEATDSSSNAAGNTVFFVCITAFILTAVALGIFLWRKHSQNKAQAGTSRDGKSRPASLALGRVRSADEQSLPPYSATNGGSGVRSFDFTPAGLAQSQSLSIAQQAALTDVQVHGQSQGSDPESQSGPRTAFASRMVGRVKSLSRTRDRESAGDDEPPATPFSPFAPFSPVNATYPPADMSGGRSLTASSPYPPFRPSGLQHSSTFAAAPAPFDPETAQAMGIHPSVLHQAQSGVYEEENDRRRSRQQNALEAKQRGAEGSQVDNCAPASPSFRQIARQHEM